MQQAVAMAARTGALAPVQQMPPQSHGHSRTGGADAQAAQGRSEVLAFLKRAGAEQYMTHFLRSGFDDMETLKSAEDADLKDLGMPPGLVARVRKQLLELSGSGASVAYDANHPVVCFLEDIGLGQYIETIMSNGFDDMDVLCEVEDMDLRDLGIPRGHALKLQKRLREHQLNSYQPIETYVPPPRAGRPGLIAGYQAAPQAVSNQVRSKYVPPVPLSSLPTEQMKSAVEQSWEQVQAMGTSAVGEILYRHLFAIMPEAVQLFPSHVRNKYREWSSDEVGDESNVFHSPALRKLFSKFINAVGCAVAGLHDNTKLVAMLLQLGQRHVHYGVHEAHFEAMGKAFTLTLRDILGPAFTKDVEDAWSMAYTFMTSIMVQGLRIGRAGPKEGMECTVSTASTLPGSEAARGADAPRVAD